MDLIYMSDAMAYQSIRGPLYCYERSWDQKNGKKAQDKRSVSHANNSGGKPKSGQGKHGGSDSCKICKEQQRRSLKGYIRNKSHEERESKCIVEENEEEEVEGRSEKKQ